MVGPAVVPGWKGWSTRRGSGGLGMGEWGGEGGGGNEVGLARPLCDPVPAQAQGVSRSDVLAITDDAGGTYGLWVMADLGLAPLQAGVGYVGPVVGP